ncbi:MAG: hypothetical protein ACM3YE_10385 [Bacteroidota bacterium]
MKLPHLLILLCLGIIFVPCSIAIEGKPKLFSTFADKKQVGSLGAMVYDGKYYWFSGSFSPTLQYDPIKKKFIKIDFGKPPQVEFVMCMENVNGQIWIGLHTKGIAVYDKKTNKFKYYNMDNGLPGFIDNYGKKYCKVSALAYDSVEKKVWAGVKDSGLAYFDLAKNQWYKINESIIKDKDIYSIAVTKDIIAFGTDQGLIYLNKQSNKWEQFNNLPENQGLTFLNIEQKTIFFVVRQGYTSFIARYNIDTHKYEIILKPEYNVGIKRFDKYLVITSDDGDGITFYNLSTKKSKTFNESHGLVSNWVNDVYFLDEDIWALTQEGISKAKIKDVMKELVEIN